MIRDRKLAIVFGAIALLCFVCNGYIYLWKLISPDESTDLLGLIFGIPLLGLSIICTWLAVFLYFIDHPRIETARAASWGFIVTASNLGIYWLVAQLERAYHLSWLVLLIGISMPLIFVMVGIEYLTGIIVLNRSGNERTGKALVWGAFFTLLVAVGWNVFIFEVVRFR